MKSFIALALLGLVVAPLCVVVASWSSRRRSEMDVFIPPSLKANDSANPAADAPDTSFLIRQLGSSTAKVMSPKPGEFEISFTSYLPGPSWQTQVLIPLAPHPEEKTVPPAVMTVDAKGTGSKEIVLWSTDQTGKTRGRSTVVTLKEEWEPVRVEWGEGATRLAVAVGSSKDSVMIRTKGD